MLLTIVGREAMKGVSKKNQKEYEIYTLRGYAAATSRDSKQTADYTRTAEGSVLIEQQVDKPVFDAVTELLDTDTYPLAVDLQMDNIATSQGVRTICVGVTKY